MKDVNLMFLLKRVPKKDSYYFKADTIEFCSYDIDSEFMSIVGDVQVLSGKSKGEYLKLFYDINLWNDNYVFPFNVDRLLQTFEYDDLDYFIEDYNSGEIGKLVYHYIPKTGNIDIYYLEKNHKIKSKEALHFLDKIVVSNETFNKNENTNTTSLEIMDIYDSVVKSVIGQNEAVKKILSAIYTNQKLVNSGFDNDKIRNLKQNVLVAGTTGTGKSEIIKQIAKKFDIPVVIEDATKYTQAGYIGSSVEDMIKHLIMSCNGDLIKAQTGILVIDEIDKKASSMDDDKGVSSFAVQNSLLKLIEGGVLHIDADRDLGISPFDFDTSMLTVIFLGAFSDLMQTNNKQAVGFNQNKPINKEAKRLLPEDFIKFGMTPEFMGRISNIVITKNFDEDTYRKILLESNISPLNLKKDLLKVQGINLKYDEGFINKIVKDAVNLNTGARGLKLAFEKEFDDLEFEFLKGDIKEIILDGKRSDIVKKLVRK